MHAVFLDAGSLGTEDLDLSDLLGCLAQLQCFHNTATAEIVARSLPAQVIITNKVPIDAEVIRSLPNLRLICAAATGVNHIDVAAATAAGVRVCNARAYATPSVAQHVMMLALALLTQFNSIQKAVRDGEWSRSSFFSLLEYPIHELNGKNMGIIGYGELGRAVAELSRAFGMQVLIGQRPGSISSEPTRLPLEELLREADVISLHCPLTDSTRNLIAAPQLAWMKSSAVLINTARGGIVNETDLIEALQQGRIAGAATDVVSVEPPPENHPLLQCALPNLIITPHVAWASVAARQRLVRELVDNILAFERGEPRNILL